MKLSGQRTVSEYPRNDCDEDLDLWVSTLVASGTVMKAEEGTIMENLDVCWLETQNHNKVFHLPMLLTLLSTVSVTNTALKPPRVSTIVGRHEKSPSLHTVFHYLCLGPNFPALAPRRYHQHQHYDGLPGSSSAKDRSCPPESAPQSQTC